MDDPADSQLDAVQGAGCVFLRWTPIGEIVFLNLEGRTLFGAVTEAAQVFGATLLADIVGSLGRARAATSETALELSDGRRSLLWSHRPIRDAAAGRDEIVSLAMDVTRYHELAQSLEASQKTLTEIADHLEQCVWIKDPSTAISGRMTYASPAFERIFGIPSESLHGRPDALFDLVHPEDLPRFRETNMMQFEREYDIEYRLNRSDGALRWLWSRAMPVRDSAGRVVRLVGITEDITSRKDNETRIRELNAELEQMVRSEQELSRTDALTGLGNRLRCTEEGDRLWKNTQRESERTGQSRSLAAVAVDLDHLKQVNDRHGHAAGDACLRSIAQVLRASVREVDVAARVGGDEFILLLPNTSLAQARQVAERILQGLGQVQVVHTTPEGAVMLSLSASIGVAAMDGLDLEGSVSRLQSRADKALYCAKQAGRQRVETADGGRE